MTNAEKFKQLFGIYATELWAMPEEEFLKWLNSGMVTNRDRLAQMNNKELAAEMCSKIECSHCFCEDTCFTDKSINGIQRWLEEKAEEEE